MLRPSLFNKLIHSCRQNADLTRLLVENPFLEAGNPLDGFEEGFAVPAKKAQSL
jgi:hypothetical protein